MAGGGGRRRVLQEVRICPQSALRSTPRKGRFRLLFGPEASNPVEDVGGNRASQKNRPLDPAESSRQVGEPALQGCIGRLDDLTSVHGDPPSSRPERDPLGEGKLSRWSRQGASTSRTTRDVDQRRTPGATHGRGYLPAPQQAGTERALPARDPVGVRLGMADESPASPLVELLLEGPPVGTGVERSGHGARW
jgi:hypothetical protein